MPPPTKTYAGGNAALIGDHILTTDTAEARRVVLVAGVGPALKALLPDRMELPTLAEDDEVHLILEYSKGDSVSVAVPVECSEARYTEPRVQYHPSGNDNAAQACF